MNWSTSTRRKDGGGAVAEWLKALLGRDKTFRKILGSQPSTYKNLNERLLNEVSMIKKICSII